MADSPFNSKTPYEYLVIGGGSSGVALATRLAEAGHRVALVEAGPSDADNAVVRELRCWNQLLGSDLDYDDGIAPQARGNSAIRHSRGRVLGGCSSHNSCIAFVPPASDFARWVAHGARGWDADSVRPFFERVLEVVHLERPAPDNPFALGFLDAAAEAGYDLLDFARDTGRRGAGWFLLNKRGAVRHSSSVAYLHDRGGPPPGLAVLVDTPVHAVLFDASLRAIGVKTARGPLYAECEVILCAGAFDSPRLLMLSGIGPADHLREVGIEPLIDAPGVGQNLLDHPEGVISWQTREPVPELTANGWEIGLFDRVGPIGRAGVDPDEPGMDLMFHFGEEGFFMHTGPAGYPTPHGRAICLTPNVARARSQGTVRLRSRDPEARPIIDPAYFTDPDGHDERVMVAGVRVAREIARTRAFAAMVEAEIAPGPALVSHADLFAYIRRTHNTVYHPVGTCRLGQDSGSVVDTELRVRGTSGLRVADASIFPVHVSVNPNLTCMMIGERAADLILATAASSKATAASSKATVAPGIDTGTSTGTGTGTGAGLRARFDAPAHTDLFIANRFVPAGAGERFDTIDPATESVIAPVALGRADDVDQAVRAARQAFDHGPWRTMSATRRGRLLLAWEQRIRENLDQLAELEMRDTGKPITEIRDADLPGTVDALHYFAGWADKIHGDVMPVDEHHCHTVIEPHGVVGLITPWNYPLMMEMWKLAPALAAGNTVVLKPSDKSPLTALHVAELARQAGFPAGVLNVVTGDGATGAHLAAHPRVDHLGFTGSVATGRAVLRASADSNLKGVSLELGGKSPHVVFPDADLDRALDGVYGGIFAAMGQNCVAGSRLFVHHDIHDRLVERLLAAIAERAVIGDPADPATTFGPLIDRVQFEAVLEWIRVGRDEDRASLLAGGQRHGSRGYYVQPTVFGDCRDDMRIARQEIFGPVLCVFRFGDLDEVIARANDTAYGLGAGVWTRNMATADAFARGVDAGTIFINTYNVTPPQAPFIGFKHSGFGGRGDMGRWALDTWTRTKVITRAR